MKEIKINFILDSYDSANAIIRKYKIAKITNTIAKFKAELVIQKEAVVYYNRLKNLQKEEVFENIFVLKKDNTTIVRIDRSYIYLNSKTFKKALYIQLVNCIIADIYGEEFYRNHTFRINMNI